MDASKLLRVSNVTVILTSDWLYFSRHGINCNTLQCNTIEYSTMLHSTIQQIFRSRCHLGWGAVAAKVAFVIEILDFSSTQILKF